VGEWGIYYNFSSTLSIEDTNNAEKRRKIYGDDPGNK
jgi:hypothetical protein